MVTFENGYMPLNIGRRTLIEVHISDLHFGAFEPKLQYQILTEQFTAVIDQMPVLDLIVFDGDIFHHKAMGNSDILMYATMHIDDVVSVARRKGATVLIILGTDLHDAGQVKLFYKYLSDPTVDIRIVQNIQFEYAKGAKILCMPDLPGVPEETYRHYLFESGEYDTVFMHGTIKGAVPKDQVGNCRLFTIEDFILCRGPIISGHVHTGGCFNTYFYYCGSPYRWQFGEEEEKGFLVVLHNLNTHEHLVNKVPIKSFRYVTMNLDDIIDNDPKSIIEYIDKIKNEQGIDYIRVEFSKDVPNDKKVIIDTFYRNNPNVKLKYDKFSKEQVIMQNKLQEMEDDMQKYSYIYDKSLTEYDKLARYINEDMGKIFITADQIKKIIEEDA
jgi:DNA repair exonuclease SbcCD nuclease subunit